MAERGSRMKNTAFQFGIVDDRVIIFKATALHFPPSHSWAISVRPENREGHLRKRGVRLAQ